MSHLSWVEQFRALLASRGYTMRSAEWDPLYGWNVLYEDTRGREREIHAGSTVSVRRQIERIPPCAPTVGS